MAQFTETSGERVRTALPVRPVQPWWRSPWVVPLAIIAIWFVVSFVPAYLGLDPTKARIPGLRRDLWWHYPVLVIHVFAGSMAILLAPLQLWTWLRERHPVIHRTTGRIYIFAGVLPAGLAALILTPLSYAPPGNGFGAVMWLAATFIAYRMIRQRKYLSHRRWMFYSVALTFSIVWGRVMFKVLPHLPNWSPTQVPLILEIATWFGWAVNLLIAQWWLERTAGKVSLPA